MSSALSAPLAGQVWKVYYYAGSQLIALRVLTETGNTLYYLHTDHLGNTSLTTDSGGNVTARQSYYPFGQIRPGGTGTMPTDIGFTGQRGHDSSLGSLMFFKARYFSPAVGRFLSADTIVPLPGNPQQFNRYAYVSNNPVDRIDPSGHKECEKSTEVGCQGASDRERREAQACADIPGWCEPNTAGLEEFVKFVASFNDFVDIGLTTEKCARGGCNGWDVLGAGLPFVSGRALRAFGDGIGWLAKKLFGRGDEAAEAAAKAVRYGPLDPGPLPEKIAKTFRGGSYTAITLSEPTVLYRVYGGTAKEIGIYWSRTPPSGPVQSMIDLALNPEWGNTATQVAKIHVPAGTAIYEGFAEAQGKLVGGGNQVVILNVDQSWVIP